MRANVGMLGERQQHCSLCPRWSLVVQGRPRTEKPAALTHLIGIVRKVDLVENLGGFVLDGLHLHQVWGVLPGPISKNQGSGWEQSQGPLGSWGHG